MPDQKAFFTKRLHSLMGVWLTLYLIFHLWTNSQAALPIGSDGDGFIHSVNSIHTLPYLPVIEIAILAVPILIHGIWGMYYAYIAKYNSFPSDGVTPYMEYPRNHAYTWQRVTAWLLIVGIVAHVVHMRFIEAPIATKIDGYHAYMVRVSLDDGLYTVAERLGVKLYDAQQIRDLRLSQQGDMSFSRLSSIFDSLRELFSQKQEPNAPALLIEKQQRQQYSEWLEALEKRPLRDGDVIAVADNFGTVALLMLRDTFKRPLMLVLYTLLVLATCFHGFNGLRTAMISWGVTLSQRAQRFMSWVAVVLTALITFLGLSAIWLTYWLNLKQ